MSSPRKYLNEKDVAEFEEEFQAELISEEAEPFGRAIMKRLGKRG